MKNIHQDLKHLFVEIPEVASAEAIEKFNCILILYSKMLANMFHLYNISDYFSNLHTMCYDIKAISGKHVREQVKRETYYKTRAMLIQDMYKLILLTAAEDEQAGYQQAQ